MARVFAFRRGPKQEKPVYRLEIYERTAQGQRFRLRVEVVGTETPAVCSGDPNWVRRIKQTLNCSPENGIAFVYRLLALYTGRREGVRPDSRITVIKAEWPDAFQASESAGNA